MNVRKEMSRSRLLAQREVVAESLSTIRRLARIHSVSVREFAMQCKTVSGLWSAMRPMGHSSVVRDEWIRSPEQVLYRAGGDSDDLAVLAGACLTALGVGWRLRVFRAPGVSAYHHVYPVAVVDGRDVPFDVLASALGDESVGETIDEEEMEMDEDELNKRNAALAELKRAARESAIEAIRTMMSGLSNSLGGGAIRGLPNLGVSSSRAYRAARVRGSGSLQGRTADMDFLSTPLPRPKPTTGYGRPALCVNERGELVFAQLNRIGDVSERPAEDGDLIAEDSERLASAIAGILHAHIRSTDKTSRRFERILDFSRRLNRALRRGGNGE